MSQQRSMIEAESTHHDFEQMSGLEQMSGRDLASITKPGGRQARSRVALGRWAALLASVSGTISVTGCVENRSTFYVERGLFVEEGDCQVSVDALTLQSGVMDLELTGSYFLPVVVANQLQPLGDNDQLRAETSRIVVEGFEVEIEGLGGATPATASYSRRVSSIVDPDSGSDPGRAPLGLDLIASGAIDEPGSYLVYITVFGQTLGGTIVETPEFVWPLEVCEGCLFSCDKEDTPRCGIGNDYPVGCQYYGAGACDICEG